MATIKVLAITNFGYEGEVVNANDVVDVDPDAMNVDEFVAAGLVEVVEPPAKPVKAPKAPSSENAPEVPPAG